MLNFVCVQLCVHECKHACMWVNGICLCSMVDPFKTVAVSAFRSLWLLCLFSIVIVGTYTHYPL